VVPVPEVVVVVVPPLLLLAPLLCDPPLVEALLAPLEWFELDPPPSGVVVLVLELLHASAPIPRPNAVTAPTTQVNFADIMILCLSLAPVARAQRTTTRRAVQVPSRAQPVVSRTCHMAVQVLPMRPAGGAHDSMRVGGSVAEQL